MIDMRRTWLVLLLMAGCGRVGFDDTRPMPGASGPTDPGSTAPDANVSSDPVQPSAGLSAYWGFDDLSSTGAMSSVNSFAATCTAGECPTEVDGVVGKGASFDGATSCMHVPSMSNWTATELTISAWVNIPSAMLGNVIPVIDRDADACPSPGIEIAQGQIGFLFMGQDSVHYHAWTSALLTGDTWHQVAVRWDGTTETVFLDGQCACGAEPGQQILFDGTSYEFEIGCDMDTSIYTNGVIDEVRIYDRALSDTEMATLAAVGGRAAPTPQACAATCSVTQAGP